MAFRNHVRVTTFVDQFANEDLLTPPNPERKYQLLLDHTDRNVSLLMKLILMVGRHPEVMSTIRELCANPAEVNFQTPKGFTPLYIAVTFGGSFSSVEVVKLLLQSGADYNRTPVASSLSMLNSAIANTAYGYSSHAVVKSLLEAGANPNNLINGFPAICEAASCDDPISIQYLLDFGADIESESRYGNTPLMSACISNSIRAIQFLLPHTPSLEHRNLNGRTVLNIVASKGNIEAAQLLLKAGAKLEYNGWRSPLVSAAKRNQLKMVRFLIQAGATINFEILSKLPPSASRDLIQYYLEHQTLMDQSLFDRCLRKISLTHEIVASISPLKDEMISQIESRGGQVSTSISIDTTILIVTENDLKAGFRLPAVKPGLRIIFESNFIQQHLR